MIPVNRKPWSVPGFAVFKPGFTESSFGYRSFKELVEDAQRGKLLMVVRDEKSGQYTLCLPAAE